MARSRRSTPANDAQRALKRRIEEASDEIAKTRLLMFADGDVAILTPFLLILIVWLAVVFASYALFVEPRAGRHHCATESLRSRFRARCFWSQTLVSPLSGLMQIPKEQLRDILVPIN